MKTNETVFLIHGLCGSRLDMWPIARRLRRGGFDVRNWSYRSFGNRIESLAARLASELANLDGELRGREFHVVTHSMGGIIARATFASRQFDNVGRVVMLAPPHHGSHAARKLAPFLGWLAPSLQQLSDDTESYVNGLANPFAKHDIEFAIIEAKKDRVIAPGNVRLDGFRDFATVNGHHGILTWYPQTAKLVENFLLHGNFDPVGQSRFESDSDVARALNHV
jgi:pimeloyl-ACP methyl ester carboxylesterase